MISLPSRLFRKVEPFFVVWATKHPGSPMILATVAILSKQTYFILGLDTQSLWATRSGG